MINFVKSELYRALHTKATYITLIIMNLILTSVIIFVKLFGGKYATTSYIYSILVANPMFYLFMAAIVPSAIYESLVKEKKLKNTLAFGISRTKAFIGQCLVSVIISTIYLLITELNYVISAETLLKKEGPVTLRAFLMEIPAIYLLAVASCIFIITLMNIVKNHFALGIILYFIYQVLPEALLITGTRVGGILYSLAMLLPRNFFNAVNWPHVNTKECITIWDTSSGFMLCIFSGLAGIVIFTTLGILTFRKRDL